MDIPDRVAHSSERQGLRTLRCPDAKPARKAIRRPIARWQTLEEGERKRKIHQYLAARGFSYDTIEAVLQRPEEIEGD